MEDDAARFGAAVGLDSASTFECIVDRDRYYFMEVNTRIQVEHRVTELCYALQLHEPGRPERLRSWSSRSSRRWRSSPATRRGCRSRRASRASPPPPRRASTRPTRRSRRTRAALIRFWSKPIDGEIRDDQGISMPNPDTGMFMRYRVAGAYDSNIALLLTKGEDRLDSYVHLVEGAPQARACAA